VDIRVDPEICDLHGQCVFTVPELFRFDDSGELEYQRKVPEDLEGKARTAATVCPTGAIELGE
jgi:ferredoxin